MFGAVYIKDIAAGFLSPSLPIYVLAVSFAIGFVALRGRGAPLNKTSLRAVALVAFLLVLTMVGQGTPTMSAYYLAVPCAALVINTSPRFFLKLLLVHLAVTLLIQAFEYTSGQYLFIYKAADGTELDESLFGGSLDVFRAKGLFQGPLSAVAFAMWMAFLTRGSLQLGGALFLCAFFASGRLGMLTSLVLLIQRTLFVEDGRKQRLKIIFIAICLSVPGVILFIFSDENRQSFILNALDMTNDQNTSRFEFWISSLSYFANYPPVAKLVGNFGFIVQREGGTENDFLRLLLDCGLGGFLLYSVAAIRLLLTAVRRQDYEDVLVAILIVVLMNLFPFIQSLSSCLLFWLYFFLKTQKNGRRPVSLQERYVSGSVARRAPAAGL
jgi:hypothetical protein